MPNDVLEKGLDPIGYNLGDYLILSIAEANMSEVSKGSCIVTVRNQTGVSGVHSIIHSEGR